MSNTIKCERTELTITHRCNLKCKLCGAYSPYYSPVPHWSYNELAESIARYFEVVDYVRKFTLSGGEPLLHPQLSEIVDLLATYRERFEILEIITNGSVVPDERTLKSLSHTNKTNIIVDNYGPALSSKTKEVSDAFQAFNIKYVVRKYYGEDAYYNGWIDMSDFSKRNRLDEENEKVYHQCIFSERFQRFLIVDGKMYICAVCRRAESLALVDEVNDRIDLLDNGLSIEQKREQIKNFFQRKFFAACEYCNGFCDNFERHAPAEQI